MLDTLRQLEYRISQVPELFQILTPVSGGSLRHIECTHGGPLIETLLYSDPQNRFAIGLAEAQDRCECRQHKHRGCVEYYLVVDGKVGCVMPDLKKVAGVGEHIFIPADTPHKAVVGKSAIFLAITIPAARGMHYECKP